MKCGAILIKLVVIYARDIAFDRHEISSSPRYFVRIVKDIVSRLSRDGERQIGH
jgi:hypothetical protein